MGWGLQLRFLVATFPSPGHVNPAATVVSELAGRGHDVRWYTGRRFADTVTRAGARFCAMPDAYDWDFSDFDASFPERKNLKGMKQGQYDMVQIFAKPLGVHVPALRALLDQEPADVFLSHTAFGAGKLLRELGGPPNATLGDTCLAYQSPDVAPWGMGLAPMRGPIGHLRNRALDAVMRRTFLAPVLKAVEDVQDGLGLPSGPTPPQLFGVSDYLYIQLSPRGFDYPRSDLPAHIHFVGAPVPAAPADFDPPAWWPRLSAGKPVVLVTQGTIATELGNLLAPSLKALGGEDVFVVATTGGADPAVLGDPPANAVIERFVPYSALLSHVDVVVSNGGFGTVQLAIAHGVPLVVAGTTEDKREVTAHVGWSGVGVNLRTDRPTPKAIAAAVERVLREPMFRERARALQAETEGTDAARVAADLLEELGVNPLATPLAPGAA